MRRVRPACCARAASGHAAAALPTSVMNVRLLIRSSDGGISRVIPLKELLHGAWLAGTELKHELPTLAAPHARRRSQAGANL